MRKMECDKRKSLLLFFDEYTIFKIKYRFLGILFSKNECQVFCEICISSRSSELY